MATGNYLINAFGNLVLVTPEILADLLRDDNADKWQQKGPDGRVRRPGFRYPTEAEIEAGIEKQTADARKSAAEQVALESRDAPKVINEIKLDSMLADALAKATRRAKSTDA